LNFNQLFHQLSIIQKIELYLIPILITFFIFSSDLFFMKKEPIDTIQTLHNTHNKASKIEIITFYEKLAKLTNVKMCTLKFDKNNTIIAKFGGDINAVLTFLQEIEKRDKIISLRFIENGSNVAIEALFLIKTFHNKIPNISHLKDLKSPFLTSIPNQTKLLTDFKTITQPSQPNQPKFTITSTTKKIEELPKVSSPIEKKVIEENLSDDTNDLIEVLPKSKTVAKVGEYVLLNKEWLKIGDNYQGYIITDISNKTIQFQKNGKLAIMELFDDN